MKLFKPLYYDSFRCLCGDCPDTCCQDWDIQVDEDTAAFYASLPGELGERVRSSLRKDDGELIIALKGHHCPLQNADGLCSLQTALGEKALCKVCREFPRISHDYGSFMELGLELSCPEAARILLTDPWEPIQELQVPGDAEGDYDQEAMEILLSSRETALSILKDEAHSPSEALALLFFWGCHTQQLLDGENTSPFRPDASLRTAADMAKPGDFAGICSFFMELEMMTEQWPQLLKNPVVPTITPICRKLAAYFVSRYWLQAVSDYDLYCRVKFILISCILISGLPGDFISNAHLFSREIENDIDNLDAVLDGAYSDPVFTDDRLLGFLR